ncbi:MULTISPECIES: DUF1129 domain-containing protein [unclassified Enterococcus]|uniref:DUF1129 domain-containing protein n=1 Tax=unclassified Enterococcus TaxID=2608891 RepID=UPI0015569A7D|nr:MULTISPECIES: DUF1129 domain-containing protein [unclassified Enterococcus]MBS7577086.1 DUF1129 domain-containing protein [Enterococcus sp. MMGLQ5-2]MBS7584467.1 DUF1129 domain-containing protein [Enterococcus sp. MMGLQ5-1]NPD12322.1 DUF1129 domain-containing protein [Enterococcus sp. MMGLQ5-1]NPD36920.1 DUF1129 domain-containing protein [Enterococcus sp. MMGLQ5-2]
MADKKSSAIEKPAVDINHLTKELTNKNSAYIFDLKKRLRELGKSEAEIQIVLEELLPEIVANQKNGLTARKLYGTVTEYTMQFEGTIGQTENKAENTTPWLMWLDNSLLLLGVLALMNGILGLVSKAGENASYGVLTLFVMAAAGGLVFYLMYHYFYRTDAANKDRKGWLKGIGIMVLAILVWVLLFSVTALLPATINPNLTAIPAIVIGAAALAVKWYLKRKYNIANAMVQKR